MRFGYALIAGSLAVAWPGSASEPGGSAPPAPEEQPNPQKFGIDPVTVVQPGDPAPEQRQSPKLGVDTDTVVQVGEPTTQTEPGTAKNRRYATRIWLEGGAPRRDQCPGDDFKTARLGDHIIEPASKGGGFYLPLRQFSRIFAHPVFLENPSKLVNNRFPMSYNGPVTIIDGSRTVQGMGAFSGWLQKYAAKFEVGFKITNLRIQGKSCSIYGLITGEVPGYR